MSAHARLFFGSMHASSHTRTSLLIILESKSFLRQWRRRSCSNYCTINNTWKYIFIYLNSYYKNNFILILYFYYIILIASTSRQQFQTFILLQYIINNILASSVFKLNKGMIWRRFQRMHSPFIHKHIDIYI